MKRMVGIVILLFLGYQYSFAEQFQFFWNLGTVDLSVVSYDSSQENKWSYWVEKFSLTLLDGMWLNRQRQYGVGVSLFDAKASGKVRDGSLVTADYIALLPVQLFYAPVVGSNFLWSFYGKGGFAIDPNGSFVPYYGAGTEVALARIGDSPFFHYSFKSSLYVEYNSIQAVCVGIRIDAGSFLLVAVLLQQRETFEKSKKSEEGML